MKRTIHLVWIGLAALILTGCGSSLMNTLPRGTSYSPGSDQALIIFMRPGRIAGRVRSAVLDATGSEYKMVGFLTGRTRVAYKTAPGKLLFMISGRTAEFLEAEVEAGKTYFALIRAIQIPFVGTKFLFDPVDQEQAALPKFAEWKRISRFVKNTPQSIEWARKSESRLKIQQDRSYEKWKSKGHAGLTPRDGF